MKLLKLLTIPAVLLVSVVLAVPVFAHHFTEVTVTQTCDSKTGQICISLSGTIAAGNEARTIKFDLFGVNGSTVSDSLGEVKFELPANSTSTDASFTSAHPECFPAVTTVYEHFLVKYEGTVNDLDLTVKLKGQTDELEKGDTVLDHIQPCTATPSSPSPSPSVSTSASPAATVAMANTGGFDFRFALIGLVVLVAGGALFLVSGSRGRPTDK